MSHSRSTSKSGVRHALARTIGDGNVSRRDVFRALGAYVLTGCGSPPPLSNRLKANMLAGGVPAPQWGVQSGDVTSSSGVVWCRSDRPARMMVEWSTSPRFERFTRVDGPRVGIETDYTGKILLRGLPSGTRIHYRTRFDESAWVSGSFGTPEVSDAHAPSSWGSPRDVLIAWSGDTNGQGWGIDPARGGMPAYTALLGRNPDLFIHCGDAIYADDPIPPTLAIRASEGGGTWTNIVDPLKDHVAQTLEDFRGAHLYPRRSAEVRALSASCPLLSIWDDHEVRNNWFPGEMVDAADVHYDRERRIDVLAVHGRRAMYEYAPTLRPPNIMYRVMSWGPLVDIFLLDGRSYRTPNEPPNAPNTKEMPPEGTAAFLGQAQSRWLVDALTASRAVWKIIACDMPIGVVISEPGKILAAADDGWANGNGPPRDREIELSKILNELRDRKVKNIVWVTADVHYAAAHHFDPSRAAFKEFDPFWEFIAGPMHATAFPQKTLDDTFGPEVAWSSADGRTLGSPANGAQHFGLLRVDGKTKQLTVTFVDARGRDLHELTLTPTA